MKTPPPHMTVDQESSSRGKACFLTKAGLSKNILATFTCSWIFHLCDNGAHLHGGNLTHQIGSVVAQWLGTCPGARDPRFDPRLRQGKFGVRTRFL